MITVVRPLQYAKASPPTLVTLSGIAMNLMPEFEKAVLAIVVRFCGSLASPLRSISL